MATIDGSIQLVKVVTDAELRQNGGSFVVAGRMAQPIQGFDTLTKRAGGGNAIPVYVVSDAQIADGTFRLKGGSALPMADIDVVAAGVKTIQGAAIPVYVVSGSLGAGGAAVIEYLLRDEFTTDEAAPLASPRTAEPGPGTLTIIDSNDVLSISGGLLSAVTGGAGSSDPLITTDLFDRVAGRCLIIMDATSSVARSAFGWYTNALGAEAAVEQFQKLVYDGGASISLGAIWSGEHDDFVFILRSIGGFLFMKSAGSGPLTLIWVFTNGNTASLKPVIRSINTTSIWSISGVSVRDLNGVYATDYGIATFTDTTLSDDDSWIGTADGIHDFEFELPASPSAGDEIGIKYRVQDATNYWYAYLLRNAGNTAWDFRLDSVSAGTPTNKINVTGVGSPDMIRAHVLGSDHLCFTRETTWTKRGATITDAAFLAQTDISINAATGTTLTRMTSWAMTSSAYDALETEVSDAASPPFDPNSIDNLITSWWSVPHVVVQGGDMYYSGISDTGKIIVGQFGDSWPHVRTELATTEVDDHNTPALLVEADQVPVVAWARHSIDQYVHIHRGQAIGNVSRFEPDNLIDFGSGTRMTYAQLYREPGTSNITLVARDTDTFWSVTRSTDYGVTWSTPVRLFDFNGNKGYMVSVQDGNILHVALYGHPTSSTLHQVFHCLINLQTGSITLKDSSVIGNFITSTNLPVVVESELTLVYDPDPLGFGIRLFDISTQDEIAICEWTNDDDAAYKYLVWNGSGWTKQDMVATGAVFGYTPSIHYHGGITFPNPTTGGVLVLSREAAGTWYIERWTTEDDGETWSDTPVASSATKLIRPYYPVGAGINTLSYLRATTYGLTFSDYESDLIRIEV